MLSALRAAAGAAAEAALATSPWAAAARGRVTSELEALFATYAAQDAATLERSLRAAAPGAGAATSANAIVAAVAAEVGRSVGQALPKDDPLDAGISAVGGVASSVMNLLFKRRRGRRPAAGPVGTLGELGRGQALSGSERGRMEEAFGTSFADVRVHTDSVAADLAGQSDARAFSIGRSIAFGAGEYPPGTLEGDALIAHELAHVVQQRDAAGDGAAGGPHAGRRRRRARGGRRQRRDRRRRGPAHGRQGRPCGAAPHGRGADALGHRPAVVRQREEARDPRPPRRRSARA